MMVMRKRCYTYVFVVCVYLESRAAVDAADATVACCCNANEHEKKRGKNLVVLIKFNFFRSSLLAIGNESRSVRYWLFFGNFCWSGRVREKLIDGSDLCSGFLCWSIYLCVFSNMAILCTLCRNSGLAKKIVCVYSGKEYSSCFIFQGHVVELENLFFLSFIFA